MIIRSANTRGITSNSWITSLRTFSNNSYWDPKYMNFGNLKVINEDTQQPGNRVPNHRHENLDILGYMIEGELEHEDSLGNLNSARPGQIQHMWCGKGIEHSEASVGAVPARYCQLWITPKDFYRNSVPYYKIIEKDVNTFGPILADLHQDLTIQAGWLRESRTLTVNKHSYIYVLDGSITGPDFTLNKGDGAEIYRDFPADFNCHLLVFEE